jgi:hypothetical protein
VKNDFPAVGSAAEVELLLVEATRSERVQAALVMWSRGDMSRLLDGIAPAAVDWRDVLVRAGLEDDDWSSRLDTELGDATTS